MNKDRIVSNLERNREWVKKQSGKQHTTENGWKAQNIMVGCFQAMADAGRSQELTNAWKNRDPARKDCLKRIRASHVTSEGSAALLNLIDLAISELGARPWVTDLPVGALPIAYEIREKGLTDKGQDGRWQGF